MTKYLMNCTQILILILILIVPGICNAKREHLIYFKGTNYELHVFKIYGKTPGKTIMIIGGIQGDEAGGFLSADLYADMSLIKGNLIVVPRANFYSILLKKRGVNVDMNRKFSNSTRKDTYEEKVVDILKELIAKSDLLLNLHDGSGFYSENWISNMRNPMRYGQSIIADSEVFTNPKTGKQLFLGQMAREVSKEINKHILNKSYHFHFNNHQTNSMNSKHKEQRKSATYYSLYHKGIPAFGIESSKSMHLEDKVFHHNLAINAFMKIFDIIPETPSINLDPPRLEHLVISVNNNTAMVIENGQTFGVNKGDSITIKHVQSNYNRGVVVDIIGYGTVNDINKKITITRPTKILVRKDHFNCGSININFKKGSRSISPVMSNQNFMETGQKLMFIKIKINGQELYYPENSRATIVKGDTFELVDIISNYANSDEFKVNFKGFVGNPKDNTGEDRGYVIRTDRDLQKRFSLNSEGRIYPVHVILNKRIVTKLFVELEDPFLAYVVLQLNQNDKRCLNPGESITANLYQPIELLDFKTNIPKNKGVQVFLKVPDSPKYLVRPGISINWNSIRNRGYNKIHKCRLDIERDNLILGSVYVDLDTSVNRGATYYSSKSYVYKNNE